MGTIELVIYLVVSMLVLSACIAFVIRWLDDLLAEGVSEERVLVTMQSRREIGGTKEVLLEHWRVTEYVASAELYDLYKHGRKVTVNLVKCRDGGVRLTALV